MARKRHLFLFGGPLLGALILWIDAITAEMAWIYYGQPDYYFRGWVGVEVTIFMDMFLGAFYGLFYGAYLVFIKRFSRRQINLSLLMNVLSGIAVVVFGVYNCYLLKHRPDLPLFSIPLKFFFALALILPWFCLREVVPLQDQTDENSMEEETA